MNRIFHKAKNPSVKPVGFSFPCDRGYTYVYIQTKTTQSNYAVQFYVYAQRTASPPMQ